VPVQLVATASEMRELILRDSVQLHREGSDWNTYTHGAGGRYLRWDREGAVVIVGSKDDQLRVRSWIERELQEGND
jgi:hypothetical protein